jgi:Ca2+-binding EF-hand superfamily protein
MKDAPMRSIAVVALIALGAPMVAQAQLPDRQPPGRFLADTDKDNQLSLAEYQTARRNFLLRYDSNRDGVLSGTEWTAGAKKVRNDLASKGVDSSELVDLGVFDMLDTDRNGTVTPTEMDAAAAMRFARADTNHDGFVNMTEAKAFLHSDLPADTNGDNRISQAEYQTARRNILMGADANKDGAISRAEWTGATEALRIAVVQSGYDGGNIGQAGLFDVIDADKNGTISPAEIDAASAARFAKVDINHNGNLTRAEIYTAMTARR